MEKVKHITLDDYDSWGSTPLNDAVGSTLSDLKATVQRAENAIGSVTVITDREENSSEKYTTEKVTRMIESLKEIRWAFDKTDNVLREAEKSAACGHGHSESNEVAGMGPSSRRDERCAEGIQSAYRIWRKP